MAGILSSVTQRVTICVLLLCNFPTHPLNYTLITSSSCVLGLEWRRKTIKVLYSANCDSLSRNNSATAAKVDIKFQDYMDKSTSFRIRLLFQQIDSGNSSSGSILVGCGKERRRRNTMGTHNHQHFTTTGSSCCSHT